jgi:hypothetical protein
MFCQAAFDQWRTTIMQHLSSLSKPQVYRNFKRAFATTAA